MIQWLAELFVEDFSPLNVFRYITFRAAYSTVTALLICFFFGGWAIRKLQELQIGETDPRGRAATPQGEIGNADDGRTAHPRGDRDPDPAVG